MAIFVNSMAALIKLEHENKELMDSCSVVQLFIFAYYWFFSGSNEVNVLFVRSLRACHLVNIQHCVSQEHCLSKMEFV